MEGLSVVIDDSITESTKKLKKTSDGRIFITDHVDKEEARAPIHSLLGAAHVAFQHHLPLRLSPDVIFTTVLEAFKTWFHEKEAPEKEKVVISVRNDRLLDLSPSDNRAEWAKTLAQFPELIGERVSRKLVDLCEAKFSTTTLDDMVVRYITLMDIASPYAAYRAMSLCGIPRIVLTGVKADWELIVQKIAQLNKLYPGAAWWLDELAEVARQFVALYDSPRKTEFWRSFYKFKSQSGGDRVTGHINAFFPYVRSVGDSKLVRNVDKNPLFSQLPCMHSSARIKWATPAGVIHVLAKAGCSVVTQSKDGAVEPKTNWLIKM